jgi:hypothetical protein
MANILAESIVSIREAAALLPGRSGRPTNFSTVWRWILRGIKRPGDAATVRLEAVRLGGRWVTSREAIARFSAALTAQAIATDKMPVGRTPTARERAHRRADERLERVGI